MVSQWERIVNSWPCSKKALPNDAIHLEGPAADKTIFYLRNHYMDFLIAAIMEIPATFTLPLTVLMSWVPACSPLM